VNRIPYADRHSELVSRCQQGERRAQYELYGHYATAMFNVCLRILNHEAEAEDALQDAFLDAFTHISAFRQQSTFGAWLKQIVVNRAINALRSRRLELVELNTDRLYGPTDDEPGEPDRDALDGLAWHEPDPADAAETEREVDRVRRAMQQLPDGYRVVLSLYLFEGYDHEEIGTILNISETTSRSQYLRGKKRLTQLLCPTTKP
jgi:RNA polymerase sigma factor (sigma-70 family)